jgi:hypothetical protein
MSLLMVFVRAYREARAYRERGGDPEPFVRALDARSRSISP